MSVMKLLASRLPCRASYLCTSRFASSTFMPASACQPAKGASGALSHRTSHRASYQSASRFASGTAVPVPWRHPAEGASFNSLYPTEHAPSSVEGAGLGWWAKVDIPAGVRLRRISLETGTLMKFESREKLEATGWDISDACNYGIGNWKDPNCVYFLKPGTSVNHADPTRQPTVEYKHEEGAYEIWSIRNIKQGEEMFCDYEKDYAPCEWYDKMQNDLGNTPLSQLPKKIAELYTKFHTSLSDPESPDHGSSLAEYGSSLAEIQPAL